ncbi:M23 family metallopeptidase [Allosaccharopolyspora coralli]|nr:M23 family metallopeptidase [Allosaccharopolyspora coralli]
MTLVTALLGGQALVAASAPPAHGPSTRAESRYDWPLHPRPEVVRGYEAPSTPYGPGHRGVDLAGSLGQPVLAAGDGLVLFAAPLAGRPVVSIEHPGGLRTTYEPVTATVEVGDLVRRGESIGVLTGGHPECAVPEPGACLHWGARRRLDYTDPLRLVGPSPVRLLPWTEPPDAAFTSPVR